MTNLTAEATRSQNSTPVHAGLVSIVMPVYNGECYIEAAIRSIMGQTYPHWHLVVVNDGSTDATASIVARLMTEDTRIQWIDQVVPPKNCFKSMNAAIPYLTGEWITLLDADDGMTPDSLAKRVEFLRNHPEIQAVYGLHQLMDEAGHVDTTVTFPNATQLPDGRYRLPPQANQHTWKSLLMRQHPNQLQSLLMRRALFDQVVPYPSGFCGSEDFLMYLKVFHASHGAIACMPHVVYHYRIQLQSLTHQAERLETILQVEHPFMRHLFFEMGFPEDIRKFCSVASFARYKFWAWMQQRFGRYDSAMRVFEVAWGDSHIQGRHRWVYLPALMLYTRIEQLGLWGLTQLGCNTLLQTLRQWHAQRPLYAMLVRTFKARMLNTAI